MTARLPLADAAWEIGPAVVADRRYLHQHPELGMQEENTARFVADKLREYGIETQTGIATTGVLGILRGAKGPGKTVLLRADMDALPIEELNAVPYKSENPGVMHACGHDAHTAMLLGVARLLAERKEELRGIVKFAFQPAEETVGGAEPMIAAGVMDGPKVDAAFGVHIAQDMPVGTIGVGHGPMTAAADEAIITIRGLGAHAARPHRSVDPIVIAGQCIVALQTLVSREVNPLRQAVITVGTMHAGTVSNVIPEECELRATVRTFDEETRQLLARRIPELVGGIAGAMRGAAEIEYNFGYPSLVNDRAMTDLVRQVAGEIVTPEKVLEREPSMGAEDMSYFLQAAPGCFFNIGSNNPDRGLVYGHHHPRFDIDEEALPIGVAAIASVTMRYLDGE